MNNFGRFPLNYEGTMEKLASFGITGVISVIVIIITIFFAEKIIRRMLSKVSSSLSSFPAIALFFSTLVKFTKTWSRYLIIYVIINAFTGVVNNQSIITFIKYILLGLIIFSIAKFLVSYINSFFANKLVKDNDQGSKSISVLSLIIKSVIYVIFLLVFLDIIGVKITPIIASLGIIGLAVAFAIRDTLSNLISGIQISLIKQYKPGQHVIFAGTDGIIDETTWRHTVLKTKNDDFLIIPNKTFAGSVVTNIPNKDLDTTVSEDLSVPFSFAYGTDVNHAEKIALNATNDVVSNITSVDKSVPAKVKLVSVDDSKVNMNVTVKLSDSSEKDNIIEAITKSLYQSFVRENIKQ